MDFAPSFIQNELVRAIMTVSFGLFRTNNDGGNRK